MQMKDNDGMNLEDDGAGGDLQSDPGCNWNRDVDGYETKLIFDRISTMMVFLNRNGKLD